MAFYLEPPGGDIPVEKLASFSLKRLQFLLKFVDQPQDLEALQEFVSTYTCIEDSDCLIEGTTKDKVSHFTLRLAACHSHDPGMQDFLVRAETLLFAFRLRCMDERELYRLFKSFTRNHLQFDNNQELSDQSYMAEVFQTFHKIPAGQHWKHLIKKYKAGVNDEYYPVPFEFALNLVKERQVVIKNGMAFVPCSKLGEVIIGLFERSIKLGIHKVNNQKITDQHIQHDQRLQGIFRVLQATFSKSQTNPLRECGIIHHKEVDKLSRKFPLCMQNLHNQLRAKHRLGHHARIQYTLFLKEAGMPINEALLFWSNEYSKPSGDGPTCKHTWQKEARRYTYNIRHLYGLEGSCINYKGHSCGAIQGMTLQCRDEGGCPYRHFDQENLELLLSKQCLPDQMINDITALASKGQYSNACSMHLERKLSERDTELENQRKDDTNDSHRQMYADLVTSPNKLIRKSNYLENDSAVVKNKQTKQNEINKKFKHELFHTDILNKNDEIIIEPSQGFEVSENVNSGKELHGDLSVNDSCYYSQDQTYVEALCADRNLYISPKSRKQNNPGKRKFDVADATPVTGVKELGKINKVPKLEHLETNSTHDNVMNFTMDKGRFQFDNKDENYDTMNHCSENPIQFSKPVEYFFHLQGYVE